MTSAVKRKSHSSEWLFCVVALTVLALSGCGGGQAEAVRLSGSTMGTTWHVTYLPTREAPSSDTVERTLQGLLDEVNASMSTYQGDSEISRLNRTPAGQWFAVSDGFSTVLSAALDIGERSEGAYDVTVAPLVDLWGFGPVEDRTEVPPQKAIDDRMALVGQGHLELDAEGGQVRKQRELALDFSSIAKGYAVDRLANWLLEQPIADFLVEVGGEMRLSGNSPRGDAWRIAIENPAPGARAPAVALSVTDVAVATSGDYRNFFELDGKRYSHSIDPRTGYPVAHDLVSVTVVAQTAMAADAWATALEVLGAADAMRVASAEGLAVYFIQRQGENLVESHTPAFEPWLDDAGEVKQGAEGPER